jgi:hypothetical protein
MDRKDRLTMRWGYFARVVLGIALVVGVIGLGAGIYQAGFTAGVATEGNVTLAPAYAAGYGYGWHGGFGIFGFLGFLLFLFLLFGLIRALAWGGRGMGRRGYGPGWGPGHGYGRWADPDHDHGPEGSGPGGARGRRGFGPWEGPAREAFDDWHRRAHEPAATTSDQPPSDDAATR